MDPYRIRDGIGFVCFEGRTIILDVTADRYWQLGADAGAALEALRSGATNRIDAQALARLRALGFVEPAIAADPILSGLTVPALGPLPPPSGSLLEGPTLPRRGDAWAAGEITLLAFTARVVLRVRPLAAVLDRIVMRRARTRAPEEGPGLDLLAQQFARLRRLVPLRPLCLPDSLAFLWFAMRRGHAPRLVFGVEAFPFTAHCWVQDGSMVLTDALDHASRFRPILVL
ncbi:lasso peptide biosynthesis B2 protein [Novosphingobium fluoreni]|uniref:lasso peptide biosynthesis B2 protein n=1 Tax=Novosphingobium fluoreni TaxID=1391222 RepID=UPI003DA1837D